MAKPRPTPAPPAPKVDPAPAPSIPAAPANPWAVQATATAIDTVDLAAIGTATQAGGYVYRNPQTIAAMHSAGLVEFNMESSDAMNAGSYACRATPKGFEYLASQAAPPMQSATPPVGVAPAPQLEKKRVEYDVVPFTRNIREKRSDAVSSNIFDDLPPPSNGAITSFHLPQRTIGGALEDLKEYAKKYAPTVSNANMRFRVPVEPAETEQVTVSDYRIDADGKRVKDVNGSYIKLGEHVETRPKMRATREFAMVRVDATDIKGPGLRIGRVL